MSDPEGSGAHGTVTSEDSKTDYCAKRHTYGHRSKRPRVIPTLFSSWKGILPMETVRTIVKETKYVRNKKVRNNTQEIHK